MSRSSRYTSHMKLGSGLAFLAAVYAGVASAQLAAPVLEAAPPLPPQYEVEIIVFANRDFDPTEERFELAPYALPADSLAPLAPYDDIPVFDETTLPPAAPAAPPELGPEPLGDPLAEARAAAEEALRIRTLSPGELKLVNEYRRRSRDTQPATAR